MKQIEFNIKLNSNSVNKAINICKENGFNEEDSRDVVKSLCGILIDINADNCYNHTINLIQIPVSHKIKFIRNMTRKSH